VPPPKEEPEPREIKTPIKAPIVKSGKSDSGSSTKSQNNDNMVDRKELIDAKVISSDKGENKNFH